MKSALKASWLGLRNSTTRIPFRYGKACLTRCPQAVVEVTLEIDGRQQTGYSGDCLPPSWFDKSPDKSYAQQIDDMLAVIQLAQKTLGEEMAAPTELFPAWLAAYERVHSRGAEWQLPPLLVSFGLSLLERAVMDALARAAGLSFFAAVRENLFGLRAAEVHRVLADCEPTDWTPTAPAHSLFVRHTVGLGDPLTAGEIPDAERLDDGSPQALEEYIQQSGLRYLKIKVANRPEDDLERLTQIAQLIERHRGSDYRVTLDGNEQYGSADEFDALVEAIESRPQLATLWSNTVAVEQPLERSIALDERHTEGIRRLCGRKPVIIDESDGRLDSYVQAISLGYRGVSSKCCKGPFKSLLNAALTWHHNDRGRTTAYLMTGEDLCTVGVIPVQQDLCLVATLGLSHVERNGHHYHPGLAYLPSSQQEAALQKHPDLYRRQGERVVPRLADGQFEIGSLQCAGFGYDVLPDKESMQTPDEWSFESLGLDL